VSPIGEAPYIQPVPIDLPRPSRGQVLRRAGETGKRTLQEFAPYFGARIRRRRGRTTAHAIRRTFERLGATYVKFGQAVASSPAVIPVAIADEFRSCLDQGPALPWRVVRETVEADLGRPLESMYAEFGHTPVASASIAVVHRARLVTGEDVAVKVIRPGIGGVVATDLDLMEPVARFVARQGVDGAGNAVAYLVGLRQQIAEELDLRNEVRTMAYFRALYEHFGLHRLVIPRVFEEFCGQRVLTMEYIDGGPIDDLDRATAYGVDPAPLVRDLLRAWVLTALGAGVFHADIHAGNLFLMPDGRLAMLDWGVVSRLDDQTQDLFRALVEAAVGEEAAWDRVADHMIRSQGVLLQDGFGASREDVRDLVKMYMQPILTSPLKDVSMAALFMSPEKAREVNHGEARPKRTLREKWQQNRLVARAVRKAMDAGHFEEEMQRQTFLAGKQLLYLERYGRMYTPDEALLGDHEFLKAALRLSAEATG
jgi:predicted unusual protein kinase regulating ubiquinone biosynthesis (AarF/ABC1/UbiB family)